MNSAVVMVEWLSGIFHTTCGELSSLKWYGIQYRNSIRHFLTAYIECVNTDIVKYKEGNQMTKISEGEYFLSHTTVACLNRFAFYRTELSCESQSQFFHKPIIEKIKKWRSGCWVCGGTFLLSFLHIFFYNIKREIAAFSLVRCISTFLGHHPYTRGLTVSFLQYHMPTFSSF